MNARDLAPEPSLMQVYPTGAGNELLRRMAGCLAHHVNNALTGVIGYLELSLRDLAPCGPVSEHLQASLDCACQASAAVKRIVTFASRPQAVQTGQILTLTSIVEQIVRRVAAQERSDLTIRPQIKTPGLVWANETVLLAALEPVLNNALEAMSGGGTLVLRVGQLNGWCQISIGDTGGGIPEDVVPNLFQPFRTSKRSGHLGLGLFHCRELIQMLGGRLEVASLAGQGTTVTILLPSLDARCNRLGDISRDTEDTESETTDYLVW